VKHPGTKTFALMVRKRLRMAGYFQQDLANALGLHPKVLSRKMGSNQDAYLTDQEVRSIIKQLAEWQAITSRDEALQLLALAQVEPRILSAKDWQTVPLSQLVGRGDLPDVPANGVARRHNLPISLTPLIGRAEAVEQLRRMLTRDDVRLLTLVGPGGSGKTRLAQEVACQLVAAFTQGVWFVSLDAVRDVELVPQTIMQALNIKPPPTLPALQSLSLYLQGKQLLLLLDNFEHLTDAADVVGELLATVPGLKVLVTSRSVLHIYGEHEFTVPPLDVPDVRSVPLEQLAEYSALQLFVDRARAVVPDFALTTENAVTIAQICARVDGLPLALELAAARIKVLGPERLLAQLSAARLPLLTGGARNLPGRQQTLRNTITWSYDLLFPEEQAWFARLGTFVGGWSLEAAEALMQAEAAVQPQAHISISVPVLDRLEHMVDNSLLVRLPTTAGQMRFTLLETLREYALERLGARGEVERWRDWHACYYLNLAESAEMGLRGAQQLTWQTRLQAEQDNIRAALRWSLHQAEAGATISNAAGLVNSAIPAITATGAGCEHRVAQETASAELAAAEVALRLVAALRAYWEWQGYLFEGRAWVDAALALEAGTQATTRAARARALSEASRLLCLQNELHKAVELAEASIALWQQLEKPKGLAVALFYRGWSAHALGEHALAKSLYIQAMQLLPPPGDAWLRAQLLFYMGAAAGFAFEFEQMRSFYTQSREIFERLGDRSALADVLKDEGGMAIIEGNYSKAIANLLKSIELSHELGYRHFIATGTCLLCFAVGMQAEPDPHMASVQAATIWGIKDQLMATMGSGSWIEKLPIAQDILRQIHACIDDTDWEHAYRKGRGLPEEQAIAFCLALRRDPAEDAGE